MTFCRRVVWDILCLRIIVCCAIRSVIQENLDLLTIMPRNAIIINVSIGINIGRDVFASDLFDIDKDLQFDRCIALKATARIVFDE